MNLPDAEAEMHRLSGLLDAGLKALREQATSFAEAEAAYRKAKATAWLSAPPGTVPEREAHVNANCADLRKDRDLADGMRQAALESVRSRRAQISALQSLLAAERSEMEMAGKGP